MGVLAGESLAEEETDEGTGSRLSKMRERERERVEFYDGGKYVVM